MRRWTLAVFGVFSLSCPQQPPAVVPCAAGQTRCGDACIDAARDDANCGTCENACTAGAGCLDGVCVPHDCKSASCGPQQLCINEVCTDRACAGVVCPMGQRCAAGQCVSTSCEAFSCAPGEVCPQGRCTDAACLGVICPAGLICVAGACTDATCDDGQRGGDESDVDCGGSCPGCRYDGACTRPEDCTSRLCAAGRCAKGAGCSDGVLSGQETALDCGGPACPPCGDPAGCLENRDCLSEHCVLGHCAPAVCTDGSRNGVETDLDCGGDAGCARCGTGKVCQLGADCVDRVCDAGRCAAPGCSDNATNGTESDTDCGGDAGCAPCADGRTCRGSFDCISRDCRNGVCAMLSCGDMMKNGPETDTDCGGPCPPCANGRMCRVGDDCASRVCSAAMTCAIPSCSDGVRNGAELGTDCGGACAPCGFAPAVSYPVGMTPSWVAIADFDNDGKLDVAVASQGDMTVSIMRGNGSGGLGNPVPYPTGLAPYRFVAARLDADPFVDVAVITAANGSGQSLNLMFNDSDGGLSGAAPINASRPGLTANAVRVADLNGDGRPDLITTANGASSRLYTMLGTGNGSFGAPRESTGIPTAGGVGFDLGDLNGDGLLDAYTVDSSGNFSTAYVLRGDGDGGFDAGSAGNTEFYVTDVAIDDFNADGKLDAVMSAQNGMRLVLGNGDGTMGMQTLFPTGPSGMGNGHPQAIVVTDVDRDGKKDLLLPTLDNHHLVLLRGTGTGSFSAVFYPTGMNPTCVAAGDLNGDGRPDAVTSNRGSSSVSVFLNRGF